MGFNSSLPNLFGKKDFVVVVILPIGYIGIFFKKKLNLKISFSKFLNSRITDAQEQKTLSAFTVIWLAIAKDMAL